MVSILYYSATGNTKYLATQLKQKLGTACSELQDILVVNPKDLVSGHHLVLMYSIHAFNAPKEVISFVKNIPCERFEKVSLIAVGCHESWLNSGNSLNLRKILVKKGYDIYLDRVIAMPLTIIVNLGYEVNSTTIIQAKKQIQNIGDELVSDKIDQPIVSIKSKVVNKLGKVEKHAVKLFGTELYANKDCISCGHCWINCPSKNIKPNQHNIPKFKLNCSMCMKCIYNCPKKAINPRFSKFIPIKDGYLLEDYL